MTDNKKITPVELAALKKRETVTIKVRDALNRLKKGKKAITIQMVAEEAGVARKTLYNRPDLKAMIEETKSLKEDLKGQIEEKKPSGNIQQERLLKLREKVKDLQIDKQKLLDQNVGLTDLVNDLKRTIADLEERLYEKKNMNLVRFKKDDKSTVEQ